MSLKLNKKKINIVLKRMDSSLHSKFNNHYEQFYALYVQPLTGLRFYENNTVVLYLFIPWCFKCLVCVKSDFMVKNTFFFYF